MAPEAASTVAVAVTTAAQAEEEELELAVEFEAEADEPAETPATAAVISAAVASSTMRFCEKMQPSTSSATSQVFPAPVVSPI